MLGHFELQLDRNSHFSRQHITADPMVETRCSSNEKGHQITFSVDPQHFHNQPEMGLLGFQREAFGPDS